MEHESSPTIVKPSGSLMVDKAAPLRDELLAALDASDAIILDLSLVEDIDLACLQVLYAAARSASARAKRLRFQGTVPARVAKRLAASGLSRGSSDRAEDLEASLVDFTA
ncbi:MAG TPA: STAS domain-containing protein [Spirochaetales bacterium]|nr:STAS domain-containing protein [Spirochaetales bacterium]HRY53342.1 STAS domain-containing protein [Spirochaetia bacterium]HRZ66142.1 STAS domain-containing protein [Spirochaetia bacterium]